MVSYCHISSKMWQSQSIVSLKATKLFLKYLCISPFQGNNRSQYTYYFLIFLVYEIVFFITFYLSMIYSGDVHVHMDNYDTFYIVQQLFRFIVGFCFGFGLILALCSRSAQLQLLERLNTLDLKLQSELRVQPSFCPLNIEFISCCVIAAIYHYGEYVYSEKIGFAPSQIYNICCRHSSVYFTFYGFYTVYWARVYINRSEYVIDALKAMISQNFIAKTTLSIILELIKLLFDVRESIQDAFGSMLFMIILTQIYQLVKSIFSVVHKYERAGFYDWADYLIWLASLLFVISYVIVFFTKIGNVVSIQSI